MIYGNSLHSRRKVDATKKEKPQLWYAVGKKMQKKSGRTERDVAHRVAQRTGFHPGVVEAVLAATGEIIEEELSDGRSVTLRGIGSFQTAVTSKGFEHPEDVLPHSVRLSRVYFKADRMLSAGRETCGCHRFRLSITSRRTADEEDGTGCETGGTGRG